MNEYFEFDIPTGGMAFWLKLKSPYNWQEVEVAARKYKLEIGEWQEYDINNIGHNAIRMGFATYNEEEIITLFGKLIKTMEDVKYKLKMLK